MDRPLVPRERTAGWRAGTAGVGMIVGLTAAVVAAGWLLALGMQLVTR